MPDIKESLEIEYLDPNKGTMNYLTEHSPYAAKLHELEIKENPVIEWGARATPDHVVRECVLDPEFEEIRQELEGGSLTDPIRNKHLFGILNIVR